MKSTSLSMQLNCKPTQEAFKLVEEARVGSKQETLVTRTHRRRRRSRSRKMIIMKRLKCEPHARPARVAPAILLLLLACSLHLSTHLTCQAQNMQNATTTTTTTATASTTTSATLLLAGAASSLPVAAIATSNHNHNNNNSDTQSARLLVARAEALTAPALNSPQAPPARLLFEPCKTQIRSHLQLTNLSQVMFQPNELCSSWHKMMRAAADSQQQQQQPNNRDAEADVTPWLYIELLNLSHNNLTVLHDSSGLSRLVNLVELRITHNQLSRCEENALANLQRLQHVDLSHNRLVALPAKFFQSVRYTLKKLILSHNSITVLVPTLFDSLASLEHLDLSHNDITSHWINDHLFKNLTKLRYLDLSFNKLTVFSSPQTFSSLQLLETLSLQHNELRQVPDTVQHLRYLLSLDLSQNLIHDITNASYLSNCKLLFNLNLESNLIENVTRDAFSDLPALKVLNLANNRIHYLDQSAFEYVPDLHALRLDSNRLIDFGQSFVSLRFLLMLNISSNRITSFDYAQIPLGLQWLDLHSNRIDKLNNFYYSPAAQISANDINQQVGSLAIISQQWQSMTRLTTLDASFNLLRELDNTSLPESLETVQLNNNHIRNIASHTFSTKSNLTRINLSHNQLTTIPIDALRLNGNRDIQQQQQQQLPVILFNGKEDKNSRHKFVDMHLAHNPIVCNCNMGWFSQLLLASSHLSQAAASSPGNTPAVLSSNKTVVESSFRDILARHLPRIVDAHLISCQLPFGRATGGAMAGQWSPVQAANQLALSHHHQHQQHNQRRSKPIHLHDMSLIQKQSELLASVHLCSYKSHCFALCYCCDFDACDCEMSCPENCSCYYDEMWSTNIVDCSANNQINSPTTSSSSNRALASSSSMHLLHRQPTTLTTSLQVKFTSIPEKIPMDVTELYLDGLELHHLKGNALIGRRNLKSLYLNNSQVYSIEQRAFATQKSLRILQLNSNNLKELFGYEFEMQFELRELYLANNLLTAIGNTTFSSLRALEVLHLQNNQLYQLNFWSNLPPEHKLMSVNLGSNPWSCQCDQVEPMLRWLDINRDYIHDKKSVNCQYNRTQMLHLLAPPSSLTTTTTTSGEETTTATDLIAVYGSANENYPIFDLRMCLNHTVHPDSSTFQPASPYVDESSKSFGWFAGNSQPPNDEPARQSDNLEPSQDGPLSAPQPLPVSPIFQYPPSSGKSIVLSTTFLFGLTSVTLIIVIIILSLVHYRQPMRSWFYSQSLLNIFSNSKAHHHHHQSAATKHSHLHHHLHPHLHHCGASSAGSTSSSSAASSNLTQALCHQQQSSTAAGAAASGLVTTPLIASNNHQLLNLQSSQVVSSYTDDDKLFDAYLSYSKLDEQFVNDFIAPELEYGQPSYRVALHYRDVPATASKFLTDCIVETANASRRIILILSEQLLETEWKQFEYRTAHLEALRSNYRQRLIIIMLGHPVNFDKFDSDIVQWLKSCTVLQWGDKAFWQNLRLAMPDLPYNRHQPHYLRYQTLAPHQVAASTHNMSSNNNNNKTHKSNLGANLLKSAGGLLGAGQHQQQQQHNSCTMQQQQQQLVTSNSMNKSLGRPLPQPEEHHYAHLTPATMIYNQRLPSQHTYHQPIYGDPQQQQQQQHHHPHRDNSTAPTHI